MSWKGIVVLLVLVAGLGAYLLLQKSGGPAGQKPKGEVEYLLSVPLEKVSAIRVEFLDTTYLARRDGLEWFMEEAFKGNRADSTILNHLVYVLDKAPVMSRITTDSLDLKMVALDPPVLVIVVYVKDGDSTRLSFGALNPTTDNIYVRRNDEEKVLLTNKIIGPMLAVGGFLLRAKGLYRFNPYEVKRIRFDNGGRTVFLATRSGEFDQWWIDGPKAPEPGDKRKILRLLKDLYNGQVRGFIPGDEVSRRETTLDQPQRTLVLTGEKGDSEVILIGDVYEPKAYFRWASSTLFPDQYLLVDSRLRDELNKFDPDSLKSLQIADFQSTEVDRIEINSPLDSLVVVAQSDTLWKIVFPQEARCKLWEVETLLAQADTMSADGLAGPGSDRGYTHPQLRFVLKSGDRGICDIVFGNFTGQDQVFVRDNLRGLDFVAKSRIVQLMSVSFRDLADIPVRHIVR